MPLSCLSLSDGRELLIPLKLVCLISVEMTSCGFATVLCLLCLGSEHLPDNQQRLQEVTDH